jgi:hypothetical protein
MAALFNPVLDLKNLCVTYMQKYINICIEHTSPWEKCGMARREEIFRKKPPHDIQSMPGNDAWGETTAGNSGVVMNGLCPET